MLGTLFFDKQDRELLRMINETIDHGPSQDLEHKVFDANLHPHGILELTTTHEYRMAHAVINLLGNLEAGGAPDRLMALRILRDEGKSRKILQRSFLPEQYGPRPHPDHEGDHPVSPG